MANRVGYEVGETEDFIIEYDEDIGKVEKVLKDNDIIPNYHEHLEQVNICILMFEELEAGRSYSEMFSDWVDGTRSEVINKNLIQRLRDLKQEILNGISYYTRLLAQKDNFKNILGSVRFSKTKLKVKHEKVQSVSTMDIIKERALNVGAGEVVGIQCEIKVIYENYAELAASIDKFILAPSTISAAVGAVISAIYEIAKNQGKAKALKYQQIIDLNAALNYQYLSKIQTNHEVFNIVYNLNDKKYKSEEFKTLVTKHVYSNGKQKYLEELKEVGIDDDTMCKIISEREAKNECKNFLTHHFESSEEEAEEFINAITMT